MAGKKFDEFTEITTLADTDIFLTQPAQGVNKKIKWSSIKTLIGNIFTKISDIADNLTTDDSKKMLSAKQGKKLRDEGFYQRGTYDGDFNNLTTPGIYWCVFANCQNAYYDDGYGYVEVFRPSDSAFIQRITRFNIAGITEIASRHYSNSQWYDWGCFPGGNVLRILSGTKAVETTGNTSISILTNEDIDELTGIPGSYNLNTAVFASNGDGNANDAHVSVTYKDEKWFAVFDKAVSTRIRINYVVIRW